MNTTSPMTTRELYSSIGLTSTDISRIGHPKFVCAVFSFGRMEKRPVAMFTDFGCALDLVKRLNAFVEGGVGLSPVLKGLNPLETDRYKRLAAVGLTPYLITFKYGGDGIEFVDSLGEDLDELSVDKFTQDNNFTNTIANNFFGTFWAPNGHLAIKKAKVFKVVMDSLKSKRQAEQV